MHELVGCVGVRALQARWEPWMRECLDQPRELAAVVSEFRSPVHLHFPRRMSQNTQELRDTARAHGIDLRIYFARKANKCLAYVDQAIELGIGVDTASGNELRQCLQRHVAGDQVIYSAAVKEAAAIDLAIAHHATIVIDNADELALVKQRLASLPDHHATLALRLRKFTFPSGTHRSRFGVDYHDAISFMAESLSDQTLAARIRWRGLHFHLDGCDTHERIAALHQSLDLVQPLRQRGVAIEFIDMGGGFPVSYLEHEHEWLAFWEQLDRQTRDSTAERILVAGAEFNTRPTDARVTAANHAYPYWQPDSATQWLERILGGTHSSRGSSIESLSVAERLIAMKVQLRCEPGRSLMNGCGMTVAQVAFRKLDSDANLLVGLAMNRTNCRTTAVDFSVDPVLLATGVGSRTKPAAGFFVGAYCTESEYITPRKFRFDGGVAVDDLVVFPNTAGYQMHFMESRSHQFDLPANVILAGDGGVLSDPRLDPAD